MEKLDHLAAKHTPAFHGHTARIFGANSICAEGVEKNVKPVLKTFHINSIYILPEKARNQELAPWHLPPGC